MGLSSQTATGYVTIYNFRKSINIAGDPYQRNKDRGFYQQLTNYSPAESLQIQSPLKSKGHFSPAKWKTDFRPYHLGALGQFLCIDPKSYFDKTLKVIAQIPLQKDVPDLATAMGLSQK